MQEILLNWTPHESRVALIENAQVQELHLERALERGLLGNIYLGRVTRVLPGMQSAFIDLGLERAAFLHVRNFWQRHEPGEAPCVEAHAALHPQLPAPDPAPRRAASASAEAAAAAAAATARPDTAPIPIEQLIHDGQALMVQVIKDPIGSKGARLSTQISLAGRLLVYLPQDHHIGISQKIAFAMRDALRQRLQQLTEDMAGGFILRTNAEDASDSELREDIAYLSRLWERIQHAARTLAPTTLLHQELTLPERMLRDIARASTERIWIDSEEQFRHLATVVQDLMPQVADKLALYRGERPLFAMYNVEQAISAALARRVNLQSGGYLIIDQTEAMTTIDVNTGAFVGARSFDDTIYQTNLEASGAIARELRLRNLGGIIILDFIDMQPAKHRDAVMGELLRHLARDPAKTSVSPFSPLGLVEMTRKRTRASLAHMLCETCPACQGRGRVKTVRTVAYDILREILHAARQFPKAQSLRVIAHPSVTEIFLDEASPHITGLSDFIGKPITLQAEATMTQEQFEIVLL